MAQFNKSYLKLQALEYSNREDKFLHKNKTENFFTCGGIYQKVHPTALDWKFINNVCLLCGYDIEKVLNVQVELLQLEKELELKPNDELVKASIDEMEFKLRQYDKSLKRASRMINADDDIQQQVFDFFKLNYWSVSKLSEVQSQKIADEIFLLSVLSGVRTASKIAQKIVGAKVDGIIGDISIKCLNNYNEDIFDVRYDLEEMKHFESIVTKNPDLSIYLDGWKNRSTYV